MQVEPNATEPRWRLIYASVLSWLVLTILLLHWFSGLFND